MKKESIHIFSSIAKLADFFAVSISQSIKETVRDRPFYIALSGGSTPREIFKLLAENYKDKIEWTKVMLFWGDERCVSPASDESNYKMAFESLIKNINIPGTNIFRIEAEKNPADEAERYSELVGRLLPHHKNIPWFDLVMLGLGEDGHTASIFPNNIHLIKSEKLFEVSRHPDTGQIRITATGKLINNARQVCFIVTGESKAPRVAQIIEMKTGWQDLPASLVAPEDGELVWMLDDLAGQMLIEQSGNSRGSDRVQSF
jgi:6-phosphogluconolactonase